MDRARHRAARVTTPPPEPSLRTNAAWKRKRVRAYKYVDDGITTEKVNFENAETGFVIEEEPGPDGLDLDLDLDLCVFQCLLCSRRKDDGERSASCSTVFYKNC